MLKVRALFETLDEATLQELRRFEDKDFKAEKLFEDLDTYTKAQLSSLVRRLGLVAGRSLGKRIGSELCKLSGSPDKPWLEMCIGSKAARLKAIRKTNG